MGMSDTEVIQKFESSSSPRTCPHTDTGGQKWSAVHRCHGIRSVVITPRSQSKETLIPEEERGADSQVSS